MNYYGHIIEPLSAGRMLSSATLNRLDWFGLGAGSISKTAAFIVLLMVVSWAICSIRNKFSFWILLLSNCILGYFLIQTYSRGSLISITIAIATFLIIAPIKFSTLKVTASYIAILTGAIYSNSANFTNRIDSMFRLESSSANVRYDLYTAGLKMLTDAPSGIHPPDTPAKIYMRWYQRMYENEEYNTLVNSHLEFLNRHGIAIKLLYILFWCFVFCITFSYKKSILCAVTFSLWLAFFANSIFSNVATFWLLWIFPLLLFAISIWINKLRFLHVEFYIIMFALFVFSSLGLFILSYSLQRDTRLRFDNDGIKIGKGNDYHIFICTPDEKVFGRKYGIELIDAINTNDNLAISIGESPNPEISYKTIIASGEINIKNIFNAKSKDFVFLNPIYPNTSDIESFFRSNKVHVVLGEITDFANICRWKNFFNEIKYENFTILNGAGNYIPNWGTYIRNE